MTNRFAGLVEPVVLVLSSCVLQQRICASSRQWTKVASSPVITRSSFGKTPKKTVFVWLSTWTNSTIPLQMTRLDGSRALLLKTKDRAGWRKNIPTPLSLSSPEIAGNDGVARVQEDPGGGDDEQQIMLSLRMDKPLMVMVMVVKKWQWGRRQWLFVKDKCEDCDRTPP